ncbi:DEAD/DEAH box helicase [bacterium]|nr:DEAD/DEAH box helicase [bacterium]
MRKTAPISATPLADFLLRVEQDERYGKEVVHRERIAASPARFTALNPPLPPPLAEALRAEGIQRLYSHQVEGVQGARDGNNVVTVTPTASGKTLNFLLPILEAMVADPDARAILIFPIKALAQDQLKRIQEMTARPGLDHIRTAIYDGDTPRAERTKIRKDPPNLLLTNPDMMHQGMMPFHTQWEKLFRNLRFVVVDELHGYKGIFGSHVLQILHRLRRIAGFYRAKPQFLAASATIANPGGLAKELTGLDFEVVEKSGAATAERNFLFINPMTSLYTSAVRLLTEAVDSGLKTIVFTKARKITELIHSWTLQSDPGLGARLSAYRSGYLPSERREIEGKLRSGELDGVIATSALEMGIDIGGLDVAILVGYPGTIAATWQRGGRVGRQERDSAVFLIALPDALDQYFMRHPDDFFRRPVESAVVDGANPYLLGSHLACAAQEVPLRLDEPIWPRTTLEPAIRALVQKGDLLEAAGGKVYFSKRKQPQREIDIRAGGATFTIFEETQKRLIGRVSGWQALSECHPGAIYLHHGETYLVSKLDTGKEEAWVRKAEVPYYTQVRGDKQTDILEVYEVRKEERYTVSLGKLKVTETVVGFEKRSTASREKLSEHPLDLPPIVYKTIGIWFEPGDAATAGLIEEKKHPMGSLHATEHASLALLPLFALCDRNDLGGISFTRHPETGGATVFLYDGHPGGVGLANRAFEVLPELFEAVLKLVEECPCEDGCPSCIHSPKCGHGNQPLDKQGAIRLLQHLTGGDKLEADPELAWTTFGTEGAAQTVPLQKKSIASSKEEAAEEPWVSRLPLIEGKDIVVFDLETQLSAEEVGGWHNAHLMRVALAVTYESKEDAYVTWMEDDVPELIERLEQADLVVGYNHKRFDYAVLSVYSGTDLRGLPSLDLLEEIHNRHGFRVKLGDLGKATLGAAKSADGLQSLQWWKEGKIDEIEKYCRQDVRLTWELFRHALEHGELLVDRFDQGAVRLPLDRIVL